MAKKTVFAKAEPQLIKRAESVFQSLGINMNDAIYWFLKYVAIRGELPFRFKTNDGTTSSLPPKEAASTTTTTTTTQK